MDLTTQTPVEIDTELARLYEEHQRIALGWNIIRSTVFSVVDKRDALDEPSRWDQREAVTFTEAEVLVRALAEQPSTYEYSKAARAKRVVAELDEYRAAIQANKEAQAPLHAEYKRRGGWTRAFLVLNTNGHVHSSMNCSTCFLTTEYGWLPSLSGHDEAEIVEKSGSDACTVCYPSAPVETASPRTILHHTEEEAQRAREEKARIKAEKEAKKAAKTLVLDLRPFGLTGYSARIETLYAAKAYLTDAAQYNQWGAHPSYPQEAVQHVAEAVATKLGTTPDAEIEAARVRAKKRR